MYKDYWFGVADNWGKAELNGDNICIARSTVYHVFFLENLAMHHARRLFLFIFFVTFLEWMDRP